MSVEKVSDEKLVERIRSKDQELYAEIVKRYQDKLFRYARYMIRDDDKAADIVQDAFIKAYVNLQSFNTKKKFSSWIYRIVHNNTMNYIRKNKKEIRIGKQELTLSDDSDDQEEEFSKKEMNEMLSKGIDDLPIKYRSPLTLFYFDDQSYEEISDVLRLPIGTIGTRINRGRKLLKTIIEKQL